MSEISKEYAKALFMIAKENNDVENFEKALDFVLEIFEQNPDYIQFLSSPGIPLEERHKALGDAFSKSIPADVLSFIKLLCEKKHIKYFNECVLEFKNIVSQTAKCLTAKVISAVSLTDDEKAALKEKLEKKSGMEVLLDCVVDESIIGGLVVEFDGRTIDGGIKRQLKNVKDVISK